MTTDPKDLLLHKIDKAVLWEALRAIASEAVLQGFLQGKSKRPIDNEVIDDRIAEALTLFEVELRMAGGWL